MMRVLLLIILSACNFTGPKPPQVGECVIGTKMDVWKLLRMDDGKYLFATYPFDEGAPVEVVTDVSAFKKVDCPIK